VGVWNSWLEYNEENLKAQKLLEKVIKRCGKKLEFISFSRWETIVKIEKERQEKNQLIIKKSLLRLSNRIQFKTWNLWALYVTDVKTSRQIQAK